MDALEALLSPQALATLFATPEVELVEWRSVIGDIMTMRWGPLTASESLLPLRQSLEGQGVAATDAVPYLVTSLARRHKGLTLNAEEQLTPFRQERQWQYEARNKQRGETGVIIHVDPLVVVDVVPFPANGAHANPQLRCVEVQGHAAANERDGRALSRKRARAIVDGLINRGVSSALLTTHGLGAGYPVLGDGPRRAERDRRAEFLILPRRPQAPAP